MVIRTVSVIAALILTGASTAPSAGAEPDLPARLDRALADKIAEMGVPGALVSFVVPGAVDYTRAVGVADTGTGTR